ncbi:MAG: GSCFA domain-containing protein [Chitinophagaceae bacterium]|nr:GSCFA domain-containing protein [Chitinophagaceae bacterium]
MNFHLEFSPKPFSTKIKHQNKLLLIGSCFTENIGSKLSQHKFSTLENPNGILFNPASICTSLNSYVQNKQYSLDELFYQNETWNSWEHHSRFSHPDKEVCLEGINQSQQQAHDFLKITDWLFVTLGSAFVYELFPLSGFWKGAGGEVVANCHKVPTDKFNKRLLSVKEVVLMVDAAIKNLLVFNAELKIIFTISPVRHLRDGFIENNRSKAILIQAVHQLVDEYPQLFYFPAYELVIDDLRDYRFFAEDMVHPNYSATNYVWDKFISCCIDDETKIIMQDINLINAAMHHKSFNPASAQHKKFLQVHVEKVQKLRNKLPYIDFDKEIEYFSI